MPQAAATRVLLIDDDDLSRSVLQLHLSAAGLEVVEAESGDAGVALLAAGAGSAIDAVLADLQMPGLHGPALAARLRELMAAETPLLAMSGSEPAEARYAGFDAFLLKPFTPERMLAAVAGVRAGRVAMRGASGETAAAEPEDAGAEATGDAAILEEATFAQLGGLMNRTQLAEIFRMSFAELDKHLGRMRLAFAEGDGPALRASAHAMKGGFSILGAREMQALGARLEAGEETAADQAATLREIPIAAERLRRMLTTRGLRM